MRQQVLLGFSFKDAHQRALKFVGK